MSQGNYNAPPPPKSGGGMSTVMIVLIIFGVLGLVCVGVCGYGCYKAGDIATQFGGAVMAEIAMVNIRQDPSVLEELGGDLKAENAKLEAKGQVTVVDFDVKGSKNTGKAHAEFTGGDPNNAKPGTIKVTLPSGKVVDVTLGPPMEETGIVPDMPDDGGGTDGTDASGTPGDSNDM